MIINEKTVVLRVFALPTTSKRATIAHRGENIDENETWTNWKCLSKGLCIHCKTQLPTKVCWEKQVTGRHSGGLRSGYATPKCWQCRSYCCCHQGSLRVASAPLSTSTNNNMNTQHHVAERHRGDLRSSYTAPKCWQCRSNNEIAVTQGCRLQNLENTNTF